MRDAESKQKDCSSSAENAIDFGRDCFLNKQNTNRLTITNNGRLRESSHA